MPYKVTTEADPEGKIMQTIGYFEGNLIDIISYCSDRVYYSLHIDKIELKAVSKWRKPFKDLQVYFNKPMLLYGSDDFEVKQVSPVAYIISYPKKGEVDVDAILEQAHYLSGCSLIKAIKIVVKEEHPKLYEEAERLGVNTVAEYIDFLRAKAGG